jgi:hypothetical protein
MKNMKMMRVPAWFDVGTMKSKAKFYVRSSERICAPGSNRKAIYLFYLKRN